MVLTELTQNTHYDHSRMVASISGILAKHAGYSPTEAALIEQAALFHDVGKCDLNPYLLNKKGSLTEQEFALIKAHTQLGVNRIASALQVLSAAAVIAAQHHEHVDGRGGYMGLTGESIHPYAKLVAVADVYDALISPRAYKQAWDQNTVCTYLKDRAGMQFDMEIVAVLLAHIDEIMALYQQKGEAHETH
ncbi:HD domain-containing protein [Ruminococcaceae bacterium OttesenSCG-928-L11]|nr:HD domain-containing protein [Ruminococcaceae bacterium OttesenSCG-928-L11]